MRRATLVVMGLVVLGLVILFTGTGFFTDWLWFRSLGFTGVFWTGFLTNWGVRLVTFIFIFIFLFVHIGLALRVFGRLPRQEDSPLGQLKFGGASLAWLNLAVSAVLALMIGAAANPGWPAVQQFLHPVRVGAVDPVLHLNLGYYLFQFPVLQGLSGLLQTLLWLTLIGVGVIYWGSRAFWRQGNSIALQPQAKTHLTILAILLFLAKIWGYTLARQGLLLTSTGLLTGVDYTAATVRLPVFNILIWIAAACIIILVLGLFRRGAKLLIGGVGLLLVASFLLGSIYPELVRALVVRPNESAKELPYLSRHISHTREAYGLDRFTVRSYPLGQGTEALTLESPTLSNLRLWDFEALLRSYEQLQTLRPYYVFNDVDIDRYQIGGRERQVMLAARELDTSQLEISAQNWVNLHLAYTHGHGVVMNNVSEVNEEGQPIFLVGNIPAQVAPETGLPALTRPQLYFGETQSDYIIVPNTKHEFDYPGEPDVTTNYRGQDGVALKSFWTRLLFALRFGDFNFMLSNYITPRSKVLLYRRVAERAAKLAPFLDFDSDPYIVMADGRLYWIIDAYTTSRFYPYAARYIADAGDYEYARYNGVNYVRNAVKVVIDTYEGTTSFYVVDEADPIIQVWQKVFPRLFTPFARMPSGLREHLRYPEQLFRIQRDMLLTYHMTDPMTFYSKEDLWAVPASENQADAGQKLAPYYVTLRLPGEATSEFMLMQPLKPGAPGRRNMVAWMAARCDADQYGQVLIYLLPKDRVILGPFQVRDRIGQNPEISKLLTLWGTQQSAILRGNLLVLPFAGDFLYVEPTYITSEQGRQPELKLIVLVFKNRIVYGSTLAEALSRLATGAPPPATPSAAGPTQARPTSISQDEMIRLFQELEQSIRAQQEALRRQEQILSDLRSQVGR